jgi:hypothetical protein
MKNLVGIVVALVLLLGLPAIAVAQYNLEEMGVEAGPGLAVFQNTSQSALGPAFSANAFYSHYACGKGYGFHITAGASGLFPSITQGQLLLDPPASGQTSLQFANLDFGFMGKLRIHEYHRPKEWAVFLGPKLQVPLITRYASAGSAGGLKDVTSAINHLWAGAQLSVQFRQPITKKKSWFIHPGVEYYFLPSYRSATAGDSRLLYVFLNFGFAFWDQRG